MTGKLATSLFSISLNIRKILTELSILRRRYSMVGSFRGRDLHLEFFFYLIYLYPETFVCFNQVVDRFAGVQNGGMILSPDL